MITKFGSKLFSISINKTNKYIINLIKKIIKHNKLIDEKDLPRFGSQQLINDITNTTKKNTIRSLCENNFLLDNNSIIQDKTTIKEDICNNNLQKRTKSLVSNNSNRKYSHNQEYSNILNNNKSKRKSDTNINSIKELSKFNDNNINNKSNYDLNENSNTIKNSSNKNITISNSNIQISYVKIINVFKGYDCQLEDFLDYVIRNDANCDKRIINR